MPLAPFHGWFRVVVFAPRLDVFVFDDGRNVANDRSNCLIDKTLLNEYWPIGDNGEKVMMVLLVNLPQQIARDITLRL